MVDAPYALAFTAGMVAAFNPCGFALLPAYLSYFLGLDASAAGDGRPATPVARAVKVGAAVSAGFAAVFGAAGFLVTQLSLSVQRFVPWLAMAIGVGLAGLGLAIVLGFHPALPTPRVARAGGGRDLLSMALFGVSYAVVSLSCTLPVFLAAVATTFERSTFVSGMSVFGAYAAGMGSVLIGLTVAVATARQTAVARTRRVLPFVQRLAGLLLAAAGAYVTFYAWYALRIERGRAAAAGPVAWVSRWSVTVVGWVDRTGPWTVGLVLASATLACWALQVGRGRGPGRSPAR